MSAAELERLCQETFRHLDESLCYCLAVTLMKHYPPWHCTLREAKEIGGEDVAAKVPCRVEDPLDDSSDFSFIHRCLGEYLVAKYIATSPDAAPLDVLRGLPSSVCAPVLRLIQCHPQCSAVLKRLMDQLMRDEISACLKSATVKDLQWLQQMTFLASKEAEQVQTFCVNQWQSDSSLRFLADISPLYYRQAEKGDLAALLSSVTAYTLDAPKGPAVFRTVNQAMRIASSSQAEASMDLPTAQRIVREASAFTANLMAMINILPHQESVCFRGMGFVPSCRVGDPITSTQFVSTSQRHKQASSFATSDGSLMVVVSQCGAPISFASAFPNENEVLAPPGTKFVVVWRTSAVLRCVLRRHHILRVVESGFTPSAKSVSDSFRAMEPIFDPFLQSYVVPKVEESRKDAVMALDQYMSESPWEESVFLVGEGGSGKTCAGVYLNALSEQGEMKLPKGKPVVAAFVPMPLLRNRLREEGGIDKHLLAYFTVDAARFEAVLEAYRILVVLDSLDEATTHEADVHGLVSRNPLLARCRVVVTSRVHQITHPAHIFAPLKWSMLTIQPFTKQDATTLCRMLVRDYNNSHPPAAAHAVPTALPPFAEQFYQSPFLLYVLSNLGGDAARRVTSTAALLDAYIQQAFRLDDEASYVLALTNDQKPAPFSRCRPLTASTLKVRGLGGRRRGRNNHRRLRKVTRKHHHSLQRLDVPLPQIFHEIRGGKGWTHKEMFHTVRPGGNHRVTFWAAPSLLIANGGKPQLSPHTKTQTGQVHSHRTRELKRNFAQRRGTTRRPQTLIFLYLFILFPP